MRYARNPLLGLLGLSLLALAAAPSAAVDIVLIEDPTNRPVPREGENLNPFDVVAKAAEWWEMAITEPLRGDGMPWTLTVSVEWAVPVPDASHTSQVCGVAKVTAAAGGRPITGTMTLQPNGFPWFIDKTPARDEEYNPVENQPWHSTAKLGTLAVDRVDLLTCAKHEFGHTLGFDPGFAPYVLETGDGDINVNDFEGIALPVMGAHLNPAPNVPGVLPMLAQANLLMAPEFNMGGVSERKLQSPYDISAVAKINGLPLGGNYDLNPHVVVPALSPWALATLVALLGGAGASAGIRLPLRLGRKRAQ